MSEGKLKAILAVHKPTYYMKFKVKGQYKLLIYPCLANYTEHNKQIL